jgi:hypothetical protein
MEKEILPLIVHSPETQISSRTSPHRARNKRHNKTTGRLGAISTESQTERSAPDQSREKSKTLHIDWAIVISKAENHNLKEHTSWEVYRIFETNRVYLQLRRKDLNEKQIEIFEDARVTASVMNGERIPTEDEHWRRLYRDEVKTIQAAISISEIGLTERPPEKKSLLRWGPPVSKQQLIDKDSQAFFLQKQQTMTPRGETHASRRRDIS